MRRIQSCTLTPSQDLTIQRRRTSITRPLSPLIATSVTTRTKSPAACLTSSSWTKCSPPQTTALNSRFATRSTKMTSCSQQQTRLLRNQAKLAQHGIRGSLPSGGAQALDLRLVTGAGKAALLDPRFVTGQCEAVLPLAKPSRMIVNMRRERAAVINPGECQAWGLGKRRSPPIRCKTRCSIAVILSGGMVADGISTSFSRDPY